MIAIEVKELKKDQVYKGFVWSSGLGIAEAMPNADPAAAPPTNAI